LVIEVESFIMSPCPPEFRPSPGDEDRVKHSATKGKWFYVVGNGRVRGIFTNA
jgi:hypothetical protein